MFGTIRAEFHHSQVTTGAARKSFAFQEKIKPPLSLAVNEIIIMFAYRNAVMNCATELFYQNRKNYLTCA